MANRLPSGNALPFVDFRQPDSNDNDALGGYDDDCDDNDVKPSNGADKTPKSSCESSSNRLSGPVNGKNCFPTA